MLGLLSNRRLGLGRSLINRLHPDTRSFRDRVIANGGTISASDLNGVDAFVKAIYAANLRDSVGSSHKFVDCSPLAGDNLAAAQVKLWYPSGVSDKNILVNFVAGDYSRATGLTGNGTNKYGRTGIIPSTHLSLTSACLMAYVRTNTAVAHSDFGVQASTDTSSIMTLFSRWNDGTTKFDSYNGDTATGRNSISNTDGTRLILGTRTSATSSKIFRNGTLLNTIATSGGTLPNQELYSHAYNNQGSAALFSAKSHGLQGIAQGLTDSEVASITTAVNNLMTAFGRAV